MSRFAQKPAGSRDGDFYVGYLSPAPPPIARFLRSRVLLLVALVLGAGGVMAALQGRFDPGFWDFGNEQRFEGVLQLEPAPRLVQAGGSHLLVGLGKHGPPLEGLSSGDSVSLLATRIEAPTGQMLEVVEATGSSPAARSGAAPRPAGEPVQLVGEIVDSKCFLGVMKPGRGKTHRACASLCIRGGIPAGLFVAGDTPRLYVLVRAAGGEEIGPELLDVVGEQVTISGRAYQADGQWYLATEVDQVRRTAGS